MSIGPRNMAALANQRRRRKRQRELLQAETVERLKELERRSRAAVAAAERAAAAPGAGPSGGTTGAGTRILLGDRARDDQPHANPAPGRKPRTPVLPSDKPILDSYGRNLLRVSDEEASPPAAARADLLQRVAGPQRPAQAAPPAAPKAPQVGSPPQAGAGAGSAPSASPNLRFLRAKPTYTDSKGKTTYRVEQDEWRNWSHVLDQYGITGIEKRIYQDVFSHEGGVKPDGTTVAGIRVQTLEELRKHDADGLDAIGISVSTQPEELSPQQRIEVYRLYFDYAFARAIEEDKSKRGHEILEAFGDPEAAAAFGDMLFRVGRFGAPGVIQSAINELHEEKGISERLSIDTAAGQETIAAFKRLIRDPNDRVRLLDIMAELRCRKHPKSEGECARANYHRIRR